MAFFIFHIFHTVSTRPLALWIARYVTTLFFYGFLDNF